MDVDSEPEIEEETQRFDQTLSDTGALDRLAQTRPSPADTANTFLPGGTANTFYEEDEDDDGQPWAPSMDTDAAPTDIQLLHQACGKGDHAAAAQLLETRPPLATMLHRGYAALHFAASNGHLDLVELLLETSYQIAVDAVVDEVPAPEAAAQGVAARADATLVKTPYGQTALHLASWNGHDDCAAALCAAGDPTFLLPDVTVQGHTP